MADLKTAAKRLVRTLAVAEKRLRRYHDAALAEGRKAPDGATYRGLDARQLRSKLKAYVIAQLSPRHEPVIDLEGAPESRRYIAANPLPGLT